MQTGIVLAAVIHDKKIPGTLFWRLVAEIEGGGEGLLDPNSCRLRT